MGLEQAQEASDRLDLEDQTTDLLTRWWRRGSSATRVSALWLEFDLASSAAGPRPRPLTIARLSKGGSGEWLADDLLPALHGGPLGRRQRQTLLDLVESAEDSVLYAFSLRSRGRSQIRIEFFFRGIQALSEFLRRRVSELFPQVEAALPWVAEGDRFHLSFDIGDDGLEDRVGLECSFERLPAREPGWGRLFDNLVAEDLCCRRKKQAILKWPGYDSWKSSGRWPDDPDTLGGFCVRALSHIKLVTRRSRPPEAKAYLIYQYLSHRALAAQRYQRLRLGPTPERD
ncbi:MAG: hypothetical protein AAFY88_24925 [Acidobacteriota bacterium]